MRSCPKESCESMGEMKAGEQFEVMEVGDGWARIAAPSAVNSWIPAADLAAGSPVEHLTATPVDLDECLEDGCKKLETVAAGATLLVLDDAGKGAFVKHGELVGYVADRASLQVVSAATAAPPAYVPPAEAPKYIPPDAPPKYIPPSEPPKYIPADAPPVYIPPAQPAAAFLARAPEARTVAGVHYVRRPSLEILEGAKAGAKVATTMPGGAKLFEKKRQGDFIEVGASDGAMVPPLGWVAAADLRATPPLIYRVKTDTLTFRPCATPDAKCKAKAAKGIKIRDAVVVIDDDETRHMLLVLLPGQKDGWGWVPTSDLDPSR